MSPPPHTVAAHLPGKGMNPRPQMSPCAQHDAPENLLRANRWIGLLARISAGQKAIAHEVRKNQAMGAQPTRSFGHYNIADPEHRGCDVFDAQGLTISDYRQHAPAARLKPDLMAAREQSPAQVLE
jgi:hypothetical protein